MDRISEGEESRAKQKREAKVSEQRSCMREMMAQAAPVLKLLDQMRVIVGEVERVKPDGSCAIVLTVDEAPLAHVDPKRALELKLPYVSGVSALRDQFIETARRRKVICPFSFIIEDRAGKILRQDTVQ